MRRVLTAILARAREREGGGDLLERELSVAIVDDREIARVHEEFLGDPAPTDVISFGYGGDAAGPFGEIVISAETALRQARTRRIPPHQELERYAIHGLLHILGHDDHTPAGRRRMRALERKYLGEAGWSRPAAPPTRPPRSSRPRAGRRPRRRRPPGRA